MSRRHLPQILAYTTPFPYSIDVDSPQAEAHATRGGKLAGIFMATDACRSLARVLRERHPFPGPDEAA